MDEGGVELLLRIRGSAATGKFLDCRGARVNKFYGRASNIHLSFAFSSFVPDQPTGYIIRVGSTTPTDRHL